MSGKTKFIWLFHECQKTMILCIDLGGGWPLMRAPWHSLNKKNYSLFIIHYSFFYIFAPIKPKTKKWYTNTISSSSVPEWPV